jgi:hypothetical protein
METHFWRLKVRMRPAIIVLAKRLTVLLELFGGLGLALCEGDHNADRNADQLNLSTFSPQYGINHLVPTSDWDFNNDGDTDGFDIAILAWDFGCGDCP